MICPYQNVKNYNTVYVHVVFVYSSFSDSYVSPVELDDGRGEGDGAKSNDGEKAWSSIIHSILSVYKPPTPPPPHPGLVR